MELCWHTSERRILSKESEADHSKLAEANLDCHLIEDQFSLVGHDTFMRGPHLQQVSYGKKSRKQRLRGYFDQSLLDVILDLQRERTGA